MADEKEIAFWILLLLCSLIIIIIIIIIIILIDTETLYLFMGLHVMFGYM
jgi:hypothetical protein